MYCSNQSFKEMNLSCLIRFRYFVTYDLVRGSDNIEERITLDKKLAKCTSPQEVGKYDYVNLFIGSSIMTLSPMETTTNL